MFQFLYTFLFTQIFPKDGQLWGLGAARMRKIWKISLTRFSILTYRKTMVSAHFEYLICFCWRPTLLDIGDFIRIVSSPDIFRFESKNQQFVCSWKKHLFSDFSNERTTIAAGRQRKATHEEQQSTKSQNSGLASSE